MDLFGWGKKKVDGKLAERKMLVCPKCSGEIGRCKGCGAFHCASCRRKFALVEVKGELHK